MYGRFERRLERLDLTGRRSDVRGLDSPPFYERM